MKPLALTRPRGSGGVRASLCFLGKDLKCNRRLILHTLKYPCIVWVILCRGMENDCCTFVEQWCFNELKGLLILNLITLLPPSKLLAFTLVIYGSSTLCFLINHLLIDIILCCAHSRVVSLGALTQSNYSDGKLSEIFNSPLHSGLIQISTFKCISPMCVCVCVYFFENRETPHSLVKPNSREQKLQSLSSLIKATGCWI